MLPILFRPATGAGDINDPQFPVACPRGSPDLYHRAAHPSSEPASGSAQIQDLIRPAEAAS